MIQRRKSTRKNFLYTFTRITQYGFKCRGFGNTVPFNSEDVRINLRKF